MTNKIKTKRKIPGSNGQYYVTISKKDWADNLKWLTKNQYSNPCKYNLKSYPNVLCIDENERCFFEASTTCMACAVSQGHHVIEFEEFKIRHYWDNYVLTIDIQQNYFIIFCQDLDMRIYKNLYNSCYELFFNEENKQKLISTLTNNAEINDFNFIKAIDKQFYFGSNVEDWFKLEEFESFCQMNNIEYLKGIVPISSIEKYYN